MTGSTPSVSYVNNEERQLQLLLSAEWGITDMVTQGPLVRRISVIWGSGDEHLVLRQFLF